MIPYWRGIMTALSVCLLTGCSQPRAWTRAATLDIPDLEYDRTIFHPEDPRLRAFFQYRNTTSLLVLSAWVFDCEARPHAAEITRVAEGSTVEYLLSAPSVAIDEPCNTDVLFYIRRVDRKMKSHTEAVIIPIRALKY